MRIKDKLFPYPVLCIYTDDYIDNKFDVDIKAQRDIHDIKISLNVSLNDKVLIDMIKNSAAEIVFHVECSKTFFRKIYISNNMKNVISIPEQNLNGNVEVCCFILAKKNINGYDNKNFSEDYKGITFDIKKGNILAYYNLPLINITKDTEELGKVSSIFSILRKDSKNEPMEFDLNGDKIKICLCTDEFNKYRECAGAQSYQPILHAIIILPALIYALDMISKNGVEEYFDYRWFKSIEKILQRDNLELNKDTIDEKVSFNLAQKLLNYPVNRALGVMNISEEI